MLEDGVVPDESTMLTIIKVVGHFNKVELVHKYLDILTKDMYVVVSVFYSSLYLFIIAQKRNI